MGGFGSGRHGGGRCTDDMRPLDVRKIHRSGLLKPGGVFAWQWTRDGETTASINLRVEADWVLLDYRNRSAHHNGGEWESMSYAVRLDWTPCHYGGHRAWWRCPAVGCGRRVAVLHGGRVFACRQCNRLAYRSQREAPDGRATRRANKLRNQLGWQAGILNAAGGKPKGMRWATFAKLTVLHDGLALEVLEGLTAKTGRVMARIGAVLDTLPAPVRRKVRRAIQTPRSMPSR